MNAPGPKGMSWNQLSSTTLPILNTTQPGDSELFLLAVSSDGTSDSSFVGTLTSQ